jgi:hypothetical protein
MSEDYKHPVARQIMERLNIPALPSPIPKLEERVEKEKPKPFFTTEQKQKILQEKQKFLIEHGIKKDGSKKEEPKVSRIESPAKRVTEYDVVPLIEDLKRFKMEAQYWYDLFKNGMKGSTYKEKNAIKKDRKEFLKVGIILLATNVKNRVDALCRLGIYNSDIFGQQNYKLDMALPGISQTYSNLKTELEKESEVRDIQALIYLDQLITIATIIISTAPQTIMQKISDPSILNSADITMRREE